MAQEIVRFRRFQPHRYAQSETFRFRPTARMHVGRKGRVDSSDRKARCSDVLQKRPALQAERDLRLDGGELPRDPLFSQFGRA